MTMIDARQRQRERKERKGKSKGEQLKAHMGRRKEMSVATVRQAPKEGVLDNKYCRHDYFCN